MSKHNHMDIIGSLNKVKKEVIEMSEKSKATIVAPVVAPEFDLDQELEQALMAEVPEEVEEVVEEPTPNKSIESQFRETLLKLLSDRKDAPSQQQINTWKDKFGESGVQLVAFDASNVFIFTYLSVGQWDKINKLVEQKQKQGQTDTDKVMKEAVIMTAVLWPKITPAFFVAETTRAGLPNSLSEAILANSYFVNPNAVLNLTTSL